MDDSDDPSLQFLQSTRFWIQRVFVPILVCIGVGGNTVTVMVLTRRRMRCSTNIYLTALAIADLIYLLFVFFLSFSTYKHIHDRKYELYWRFFGLTHWLCDAASSTSVWLTVSFTLERYIAVCHPMRGKTLCTENRAKSIIVIVTIFCLLTTASTTFEYELNLQEDCLRNCTPDELKLKKTQQSSGNSFRNTTIHYLPNHDIVVTNNQNDQPRVKWMNQVHRKLQPEINKLHPRNCTSPPHFIYVFSPGDGSVKNNNTTDDVVKKQNVSEEILQNITKPESSIVSEDNSTENDTTCCLKKLTVFPTETTLGKNTTYRTFMYWYSAIWFGLVPLVLIATLNCFLVQAVYKSQKRRRNMTSSQVKVSLSNENRITVMLIGVVILFLICQTPTASFLIYKSFHKPKAKEAENLYRALGNIFNSLVTANASFNFLLYCVLSKKFRVTFRLLFCERRKSRTDTIVLSTSRSSNKFGAFKNGFRRTVHSEYRTPRNLETQSLTSIPRSKSLMVRPLGKAKTTDLNI